MQRLTGLCSTHYVWVPCRIPCLYNKIHLIHQVLLIHAVLLKSYNSFLLFIQIQLCKTKLHCHVLFRDKRLCPQTLPNTQYLISLCLIVLLSNNMLTEACSVWGVMSFLELLTRSACSNLWGEFLILWWLWNCLNTHPIAPERQTDKASAFIEVLKLADDKWSGLD